MNSQWIGSKPIRTNWATKKPASYASEGRGNGGGGIDSSGSGPHMNDKPPPHHHRLVVPWNFFSLHRHNYPSFFLVLFRVSSVGKYIFFIISQIQSDIADIIHRSATRKSFKRVLPQIAPYTAVASPIRTMKTQSAGRSHRSAASLTSGSSETREELKRCCDSRC